MMMTGINPKDGQREIDVCVDSRDYDRLTLYIKDCAAMVEKMYDANDLQEVLIRNGFVRCDIAACNCGSWHHRYGLPERLNEVKDMIGEAGHPLCNENGNLVNKALGELIAERDKLRELLTPNE